MTRWHTLNSNLVGFLARYRSGEVAYDVRVEELRGRIKEFKQLRQVRWGGSFEPVLYTLEFHLPDLVIDDPARLYAEKFWMHGCLGGLK